MILKRFYEETLAHASYLVGCAATGEAVVVDPHRDLDVYLDAARAEDLRIVAIAETHIHADYLSGSRELSHITGSKMYLSDEGDADWKYEFSGNIQLVKDGDTFRIGNLEFIVLHTPGHTPEHITFLVKDLPAGDVIQSAFTGDFVFVGDVGRPDLLERAAGYAGTMEAGAKRLYESLEKFKALPDHLLIWPAHGAGSACGKSLGGVPVSSLGFEKQVNWAFRLGSPDEFVREVLAGQPEPPRYFAEMKRRNKVGPAFWRGRAPVARLQDGDLDALLRERAWVIDLRPASECAEGCLPGAINIPYGRSLTNWAGWFLPYDRPFYFVSTDEQTARAAQKTLALIGLDEAVGWFGPEAVAAVAAARGGLPKVSQVQPEDLVSLSDATILDVRGASECSLGMIPGAEHRFLGTLPDNLADLDRSKPVVLQCQGGGRSSIAASILIREGFENVHNLVGGFGAYRRTGLPVREPATV